MSMTGEQQMKAIRSSSVAVVFLVQDYPLYFDGARPISQTTHIGQILVEIWDTELPGIFIYPSFTLARGGGPFMI